VTPFKSVAQTVISEAPKAAKASQPFFESFIQFLTTTEPATLAEYGVILYAIYLITPFAFRFISASQRGYADNLRPAQALDFILKDSNAVIVDLRIESEVNSKGLLDLPQSARSQLTIMERPVLTKGKFTKTAATESEMAAVMLSAMKTVKQNQPVILLDQAGRQSKSVAKELTKKGYSQVYALEGGFEGWVKAQLKIRAAYNVSVVGEPATPGRFQFRTGSQGSGGNRPINRRRDTAIIEVEAAPRKLPGSISFKALPMPKKNNN